MSRAEKFEPQAEPVSSTEMSEDRKDWFIVAGKYAQNFTILLFLVSACALLLFST